MKTKSGKMTVGILTILLSVSFMFMPISAPAEPIRLKYADFMPASAFTSVQMERWKNEVEKQTGGKVAIETFPNSKLLGAVNMIDGIIEGKADIGCFVMSYLGDRFVITNGTSLPLKIPDARVGSLVLWDIYNKYKPESFAKVKVLTMFTTAPSNIMSKKPVRGIRDIKGLDLRASGGAGQILKAWGANLADMPIGKTPEALAKGQVQGLLSTLDLIQDMNFAETCRFVTMTNTAIYPLAVVMNLDKWNSLPEDVRKIMADMGAEQAEWTGKYVDNHVKEAIAWAKETYQVEFIEMTKAQKTKFDYLIQPLTSQWIRGAKAKGFPAGEIVKDIRKFIRKYSQ